jgi:hypothetical protein
LPRSGGPVFPLSELVLSLVYLLERRRHRVEHLTSCCFHSGLHGHAKRRSGAAEFGGRSVHFFLALQVESLPFVPVDIVLPLLFI